MFTLLIVFVVVLALCAVLSLAGGPVLRSRRGRTIIVEREAPRERVVERRVVERPTVVEREYDV